MWSKLVNKSAVLNTVKVLKMQAAMNGPSPLVHVEGTGRMLNIFAMFTGFDVCAKFREFFSIHQKCIRRLKVIRGRYRADVPKFHELLCILKSCVRKMKMNA